MNELNEANFEATEANLTKLEKVWDFLQKYETWEREKSNTYDDWRSSYRKLLKQLPLIDGWKPTRLPFNFSQVEQLMNEARNYQKDFDTSLETEVYNKIEKPGEELHKYRSMLNQKRQQFVGDKVLEINVLLESLRKLFAVDDEDNMEYHKKIDAEEWQTLKKLVQQIETLLGNSIPLPSQWDDMTRHLRYGQVHDLRDIIYADWPSVTSELTESFRSLNENDSFNLATFVISKLNWERLTAEDFERLIFNLVALEPCYQNPQWLTLTNAPDRGIDILAKKYDTDKLISSTKQVGFQCKHWQSKSISEKEIHIAEGQMDLWDPRIDILVIVTTGSFTINAIQYVENYNKKDRAMKIEILAGSDLERILAKNPALVAEFNLR